MNSFNTPNSDSKRRSAKAASSLVQGVLFDDTYVQRDSQSESDSVGYVTQVVCKLVGVSYRQLDYWTTTNLITASIQCVKGSGNKRLYSFRDILMAKVVKSLLDAGVSLQQIRKALKSLDSVETSELSSVTLMSDGVSIYRYTSNDDVIDLLENSQGVFGVTVGSVYKDISRSLAKLPEAAKVRELDEFSLLRNKRTVANG
jgi:DNA-binding transcriptional MerR regulator